MYKRMSLNRLVALAVALLAVLAVLVFGIRMYGNSRVSAQELSTVQEAVQEAVQARAEAGKVDVQQAQENRTKRESVRLVLERAKGVVQEKRNAVQAIPGVPDCVGDAVGDAERIRLLNESIRAVNAITAVIAAPGVLPERL